MRLLITRHGQTIENELGIFQGHIEGTLTKKGVFQAQKLAERLQHESIDAIFTSDLLRAYNTALEIKKFHSKTKFFSTRSLRERNLGILQNTKKSNYDAEQLTELYTNPPQGENILAIHKRAIEFHDMVTSEFFAKTVLYVTHQGMKNILINYLLKEKPDTFRKFGNTSLTEIHVDNSIDLKIYNCTKHLE